MLFLLAKQTKKKIYIYQCSRDDNKITGESPSLVTGGMAWQYFVEVVEDKDTLPLVHWLYILAFGRTGSFSMPFASVLIKWTVGRPGSNSSFLTENG